MLNCIKIIVEGGCVVDVVGLPEGWVYEIEDHDVDAQIMRKPTTTIKIYRRQDGNCIWAGSGKLVDGEIVDCAAALAPEGLTYSDGAEAEASERAYDAIEDAISQGESECESDGITYTWTLELD